MRIRVQGVPPALKEEEPEMVVLGDVFAVVAVVLGASVSAWALTLCMAVLFERRSVAAQGIVERSPWKAFGLGLALLLFPGWIALALLAMPLPGAKLFGFLVLLALLGLSFVGMSGFARLVGRRIEPLEVGISSFRAMGRGSGILVLGSLVPFVGWFGFAPLLLVFATGAGFLCLFSRVPAPAAPSPALDLGAA